MDQIGNFSRKGRGREKLYHKSNVEIYETQVIGRPESFFSMTIVNAGHDLGKYKISHRAFNMGFGENRHYHFVKDRTFKDHDIYLADAVVLGFFRGLKKLTLWRDEEFEDLIRRQMKKLQRTE